MCRMAYQAWLLRRRHRGHSRTDQMAWWGELSSKGGNEHAYGNGLLASPPRCPCSYVVAASALTLDKHTKSLCCRSPTLHQSQNCYFHIMMMTFTERRRLGKGGGRARTWTHTQRERWAGGGRQRGEENLSWNPLTRYSFLYPLVRAPWCPRLNKQQNLIPHTWKKEIEPSILQSSLLNGIRTKAGDGVSGDLGRHNAPLSSPCAFRVALERLWPGAL